MKKILLVIFLFLPILLIGQPLTMTTHHDGKSIVGSLDSAKWKMKMMRPDEGVKAGLHKLYPEDIETLVWNIAKVPGDVYTDLWLNGVIEDPYFGRNTAKAQWVQHYEWWYTVQFNTEQALKDKILYLNFEGVDYECDVWLNGIKLGSHEGAFTPFSFDITNAIRMGKTRGESYNMLTIRLAPPPQVNANVAGKKTPWFGDYWRDLIPFGIWRSITISASDVVRLEDVYANTKINDDGSADVVFEITADNMSDKDLKVSFDIDVKGKNFESELESLNFEESLSKGKNLLKKTMHFKDAKLWWPWDMGEQNLYTAKVKASVADKVSDIKDITYGVREVSAAWNPGFTKDEVSFPRTTLINSKVHFIRSACWGGPPNIFVGRSDVETYKNIIKLAKEANLNNIRIFGWHPPEIPEFYELCDEAGMSVWMDVVPLGTGNIPQNQEYVDEVIDTAVQVIRERRNHPCIVNMEGGEELFLRTRDVVFARNFLEKLGKELQKNLNIPYVPDSPLTCENSRKAGYKSKEAVHALSYFYNMGHALMEDWYRKLDYPIVPEFAITSVPNVESLKKFIPADELWEPGVSWGHHWADIDHLKMQNFDTFNDEKYTSLEEFVEATQISQGVIFQNGVEFMRRQKPRLSAIALCHLITYWPDMKWALIDNYGVPKKSLDYVRKAYQPLLICFDFEKRRWLNNEPFKGSVWIVNDFHKKYQNCDVNIEIKDDSGKIVFNKTLKLAKIDENSAFKVKDFNEDVLKTSKKKFYLTLKLKDENSKILSENDYFFLIGNQEESSKKFKEMGKKMRQKNSEYTYGNYYMYFPEKLK